MQRTGNGSGRGTIGAQIGYPLETYFKAAEEASIAAQFVLGLAHLEGYCVEKNGLSAYYWLRASNKTSAPDHRVGTTKVHDSLV